LIFHFFHSSTFLSQYQMVLRLYISKNIPASQSEIPQRTVDDWNQLPQSIMDATCRHYLDMFQNRLSMNCVMGFKANSFITHHLPCTMRICPPTGEKVTIHTYPLNSVNIHTCSAE